MRRKEMKSVKKAQQYAYMLYKLGILSKEQKEKICNK